MKRNKLLLSAGILLIISASICIISVLVNMLQLVFAIDLLSVLDYEYTGYEAFIELIALLGIIGVIIIQIAEVITFMILGIKIIKRSKDSKLEKGRNLIITTCVLSYIAAFLSIDSISLFSAFGTFLASAIILTCALSKKQPSTMSEQPNPSGDVSHMEESKDSQKSEDNKSPDSVEKLKELMDKNLITREEYINLLTKIVGVETNEKKENEEK